MQVFVQPKPGGFALVFSKEASPLSGPPIKTRKATGGYVDNIHKYLFVHLCVLLMAVYATRFGGWGPESLLYGELWRQGAHPRRLGRESSPRPFA